MRRNTLLKIIGLLRINTGLTILGISKRLKIGYRPAYNHISSMEKEQIIKVERVGNAKQCFINLKSQKTRNILCELDLLKKEEIYKKYSKVKLVLESLISKLTKEFISDIHSIVLFGSYAKKIAKKDSDIDLLFIVSNLKNIKLRESIERESASYYYSHNVKISPLITDIDEFKKMLNKEELNVGKEAEQYGISLYGSEMFWRLLE